MIKIGIPRGLYHQTHYPWWQKFFTALGAEVLLSPPTNEEIMALGLRYCLKEACLPVKVMHGHVLALKDRVDYLFLPRWSSLQPGEYLCPQLAGSPLMIRHTLKGLPPLISPEINLYSQKASLYQAALTAGKVIGANKKRVRQAFLAAGAGSKMELGAELRPGLDKGTALKEMPGSDKSDELSSHVIGLLGHDYTLLDAYLNLNLVKKLQQSGVKVIAPSGREPGSGGRAEANIFWTSGVDTFYTLRKWLKSPGEVQGIIYLMPFGCGVDAFMADLAEKTVRQSLGPPFLLLTLDEHSGEAGMGTRLEAFLDTVAGYAEGKEAVR